MKPMLAKPTTSSAMTALVDNDSWSFSPKVDGTRLVVEYNDGKLTAFGRSGDKRDIPPFMVRWIHDTMPAVGHFVLDGELLRTERTSASSREKLCSYFVFDMPLAGELISSRTPYASRLIALEKFAEICWDPNESCPISVLESATEKYDKLRMVRRLQQAGAEGIVMRRLDGRYLEGKRSDHLLKMKFIKDADCVVIGANRDGKSNLVLGVYVHPDDPEPTEVGVVSSLTGDGPSVRVGNVVTVTYLEFTKGGRLREPVTPRLRFDKDPRDCDWDQLVPVEVP